MSVVMLDGSRRHGQPALVWVVCPPRWVLVAASLLLCAGLISVHQRADQAVQVWLPQLRTSAGNDGRRSIRAEITSGSVASAPSVVGQAEGGCETKAEGATPQPPAWYSDTPFDLVFAWYNHTDPARQELIRKYNPEAAATDGTEPNRGEIYLALASAHHFAPWVRRVFIVVPPGQGRGLRLDLLAPELVQKVEVVEESAFVPAKFLPTFSSIVVESFLHDIPGISEHFLYMMDDVLFGEPFTQSLAFSDRPGVGNVFLMKWRYLTEMLSKTRSGEYNEPWRWPFYNTGQLLERRFDEPTPRLGWHAGYMLSKTAYKVAWALFRQELDRTAAHRFRVYKSWADGGDIVPHLLVQHTAIRLGLQELVLSYGMPWNRSSDTVGSMSDLRLPQEAYRKKHTTYVAPDCTLLKGLPKGVLQHAESEHGVTFANLNKLQNTKENIWRRLCKDVVDVLSDGFDAAVIGRGCLCESPTVGGSCLAAPAFAGTAALVS